MTRTPFILLALASVLMMSACSTIPSGPNVLVLPGTGKSFAQFQQDDAVCRDYALAGVGGKTPAQASTESGIKSAVVGTAIGTAAGAALGGHEGAAVGAGAGLIAGSAAGTGAAESTRGNLQRRYDTRYIQCMYAKGNRVPVYGSMVQHPATLSPPPGAPKPPAGTPPLPPPGAPTP
jgi:uncharacterized protein YcfJ